LIIALSAKVKNQRPSAQLAPSAVPPPAPSPPSQF
jgi:hypothetical protein